MTFLNINKGFEAMMPKPPPEEEEELHKHELKFKFFKREFVFRFQINKVKE